MGPQIARRVRRRRSGRGLRLRGRVRQDRGLGMGAGVTVGNTVRVGIIQKSMRANVKAQRPSHIRQVLTYEEGLSSGFLSADEVPDRCAMVVFASSKCPSNSSFSPAK